MHEELRQALRDFIAASATRDAGKIAAALERVTKLHAQLPGDAPAMLRHYLQQRSYQKALEFLESEL
jgi:hypothetical protein